MEKVNTRDFRAELATAGMEIARRAEDICKDLEMVTSIDVIIRIRPDEVTNYEVIKNHAVVMETRERTWMD